MGVTELPSWQALQGESARLREARIENLFALEPDRLDYLCLDAAGLYLDLSKNNLDKSTWDKLLTLAKDRQLPRAIDDIFTGKIVNPTENRPALHTLLRGVNLQSIDPVESERIMQINQVRERMGAFSDRVASGDFVGYSGAAIRDVVNIGIGGSHLGPQLVCDALRYDANTGVNVHFVSNCDGGDLDRVLAPLNPESTYFIVASKSFTTAETLLNAKSANAWILDRFDNREATGSHFAAVTAKSDLAIAFGIDTDNIYPMWDWVGGRYSLWSAIGLPVAIKLGADGFRRLLAGAYAMDEHFRTAPLAKNIPVMLALVGIWNNNFLGCGTHAVIPYDDRLRSLPEYLQQLEMESNGKRTTLENDVVNYATAPVLWGGVGTNVQHAFFQQMHQGTGKTSIDFIVALSHPTSNREHHDMLVANCLAQAEGLMKGRPRTMLGDAGETNTRIDLPSHRETPGNRPNTMIVTDALTPETLGALLALFEHKTYMQGVIWGINSFDQWGVELGKNLADAILSELDGAPAGPHDPSTNALLARFRKIRQS